MPAQATFLFAFPCGATIGQLRGDRCALAKGNSDGTYHVLSRMTVKAGRDQDFIRACNDLAAQVRANEKDLIYYEFFKLREYLDPFEA